MGTKKAKALTMRQQLRAKASGELGAIKAEALAALKAISDREKIDRSELVKAISVASHQTADHFLVTQLANRYEAEIVKLWNNQQDLPLANLAKDSAE